MVTVDGSRGYPLYRYVPSIVAAAIFCIIFLAATIIHSIQMVKTKTWFLTALVVGGLFEFIGYAARMASARQEPGHYHLMPFIIQNTYILVAPALFAATIYMILGRIIRLTEGESHSIIKASRLTKTFVWGDILCFLMQGAGGGLIAKDMKNVDGAGHKTGGYIIVAGLFLQFFWFVFFVVVAGVFHYRMNLIPTMRSQLSQIRWSTYLRSLYMVSGLIMIRSIVRIVEYLQGYNGYLLGHEAFLYVFDSLPMFAVMIWMIWKHPSEIVLLQHGQTVYTDGLAILKFGNKKQDKWPMETVTEV